MSWLTPDERKTLTYRQKIALRDERKQERWPDTDGRRPGVVSFQSWLMRAGQRVTVLICRAAVGAVVSAAEASLNGGDARHEFAVETLLASAKANAITMGRKEAAGLIAETYDELHANGVL